MLYDVLGHVGRWTMKGISWSVWSRSVFMELSANVDAHTCRQHWRRRRCSLRICRSIVMVLWVFAPREWGVRGFAKMATGVSYFHSLEWPKEKESLLPGIGLLSSEMRRPSWQMLLWFSQTSGCSAACSLSSEANFRISYNDVF